MIIGQDVYVKLDIIDLDEVNKVLPRQGEQMFIVGQNGEMPQPIEGKKLITSFSEFEEFKQTQWFKGTLVGSRENDSSYDSDGKYLVKLSETGQLVQVHYEKIFEASQTFTSIELPSDDSEDSSEEEIVYE